MTWATEIELQQGTKKIRISGKKNRRKTVSIRRFL